MCSLLLFVVIIVIGWLTELIININQREGLGEGLGWWVSFRWKAKEGSLCSGCLS